MKRTFEIVLFNQKFSLKSDAEEQHVRKVADYVNKKIFDIQAKTHSVSSLNVALLAALNIADEYFKSKSGKKGQSGEALDKLKQILNYVDQALETD